MGEQLLEKTMGEPRHNTDNDATSWYKRPMATLEKDEYPEVPEFLFFTQDELDDDHAVVVENTEY